MRTVKDILPKRQSRSAGNIAKSIILHAGRKDKYKKLDKLTKMIINTIEGRAAI